MNTGPRKSTKGIKRVGPWIIGKKLGEGGNGQVWRAQHHDGRLAALKVLHARFQAADHPRFTRFRDEIAVHRRLSGQPGILPVVEANLPEEPGRGNPAWLTTALATPIKEALARGGLHEVVSAIGSIANTLARLHGEGISHRDLKPSNLYWHEGQWVLGDFGLTSFPDKEPITASGEKLGPANFLAPEMLSRAKSADGRKADVYSLAKTLWVLATDQNFPPPGELRIDVGQLTMGGYVAHPRIHLLDLLVERATRHDPPARPSMADMAAELGGWLAPPSRPSGPPDLSDLAARIAAVSGPALRAEERRQWRIEQGPAAFRPLKEHLEALGRSGAHAIPGSSLTFGMEGVTQNLLLGGAQLRTGSDWLGEHSFIIKGPGSNPVTLRGGVCVAVPPNDQMVVFAGYLITGEWPYSNTSTVWADRWGVPIGSVEQERKLSKTIAGLSDNLQRALESYAQALEARWPSQGPPQPGAKAD